MITERKQERLRITQQCTYCGNNPVPHFTHWYFETVNIILTPIRRVLFYNSLVRWLGSSFRKTGWVRKLVQWLAASRLIRYQNDIQQCRVRRAQVLWEEALCRGIEMKQLVFLNKPLDIYTARQPVSGKEIVFFGLPRPIYNQQDSLDWMDDKRMFKNFCLKHNLPVPAGDSVTRLYQARKLFDSLEKPVIVKPRSGSRGRHSMTYVSNQAELTQAFKVAKQLCHWVMVEEQLSGPVYRATVINFELCGVLRGDSPQVIGDGVLNIKQLAENKNMNLPTGVKPVKLDSQAERFLRRQGLSFEDVPKSGTVVFLSEKIGVNYGGSSSEDYEICHPDNKALFMRAARALGDPIVGFDFIIPDITRSWRFQKCGFIEANSLPFINLHHDPLLGRSRNVAAKVWDMIGF